ncbi:hypothetical protein L7F22_004945 [Adiantum nelumboides]|nr:hypothetical protein [Adiantum nelumboides]
MHSIFSHLWTCVNRENSLSFSLGDGPQPSYGTIESTLHNSVHVWARNHASILYKDMGSLYASRREPIFYIHHANIDRLWEVWRGLGREDIDNPDYLDSEFSFYDENAQLVNRRTKNYLVIHIYVQSKG